MMLAWAGKICPGCGPLGCSDCPTESEPLCLPCPICDRRGCSDCSEMGLLEITCCPRKYVDAFYWELLRFARLFKNGSPPIAGGALDQEIWFLECCEYLWAEMDAVAPQPMF